MTIDVRENCKRSALFPSPRGIRWLSADRVSEKNVAQISSDSKKQVRYRAVFVDNVFDDEFIRIKFQSHSSRLRNKQETNFRFVR